jgi:hypothetical protein
VEHRDLKPPGRHRDKELNVTPSQLLGLVTRRLRASGKAARATIGPGHRDNSSSMIDSARARVATGFLQVDSLNPHGVAQQLYTVLPAEKAQEVRGCRTAEIVHFQMTEGRTRGFGVPLAEESSVVTSQSGGHARSI